MLLPLLLVLGATAGLQVPPPGPRPADPAPSVLRLPPCEKAPRIDGLFSPGEWDGAFLGTGQIVSSNTLAAPRQVRYWFTYDAQKVFVAVQSELPPWGTLSARERRLETEVDGDHHLEVFLDPFRGTAKDQTFYQFMGNPKGSIYDMGHNKDYGAVVPFAGDWEFKNSVKDGVWTAELATRADSLNGGVLTPGAVWGVNFCMGWQDPFEYTAWPSPAFFDKTKYLRITLDPEAPIVGIADWGGLEKGDLTVTVGLTNPAREKRTLNVSLVLDRDGKTEQVSRSVELLPTAAVRESLALPGPLGKKNRLHLRVTSADGKVVYFEHPWLLTGVRGGEKWLKPEAPAARKIGAEVRLEAYFYPGTSRVLCKIGFEGYKKSTQVREARVVVKGPDGAEVTRAVVTDFDEETAEPLVTVPRTLAPGAYLVEVSLHDAKGQRLAGPTTDTFSKKIFPFEGNRLGISDKVLPPWTSLQLDRTRDRIDCWGREHAFKGDGLFSQVKTQDREILARPVEWIASADGKDLTWTVGSLAYAQVRDHAIDATASAISDKVEIKSRLHVEYDGMVKYDVELIPRGDGVVERLDLVVPVKAEYATLLHATSDGCRTNYAGLVPAGEGRVWDSTKVQQWVLTGTFIPYVWIGTERLGLCWWADSDEGWVRPRSRKEPAVEVVRKGQEVQLVFHVIARPFKLTAPRKLTFALEATPVRPRPTWARTVNVSYGGWMTGPNYDWMGSTGWCLGGSDKYKDWEYTCSHIMPVNEECAEDLKRRTKKAHESGRKVLVYTDIWARSFARDEVKYYAWEWKPAGETPDKAAIERAKPYEGMRVNYARSRVDFDLWALNENMKMGVDAHYFDEIQATGQRNAGAGLGYRMPDGELEGECSLFAMRDYYKRLYTLMVERGDQEPLIAVHTTSTLYAGPLAFTTMALGFENDNTDPTKRQLLMFGLPYLRAENACLQYGFVGSAMPRELFAGAPSDPTAYRSYVGVQILHDMRISWDDIPSRKEAETALTRFGLGEPDCDFVGYWEAQDLYDVRGDSVKVSVYHRPSTRKAILIAVNVTNDPQTLRWTPKARFGAAGDLTDAITPQDKPVAGGDGSWSVPLKPYDYRLLLIDATDRKFWERRPWLKEPR